MGNLLCHLRRLHSLARSRRRAGRRHSRFSPTGQAAFLDRQFGKLLQLFCVGLKKPVHEIMAALLVAVCLCGRWFSALILPAKPAGVFVGQFLRRATALSREQFADDATENVVETAVFLLRKFGEGMAED